MRPNPTAYSPRPQASSKVIFLDLLSSLLLEESLDTTRLSLIVKFAISIGVIPLFNASKKAAHLPCMSCGNSKTFSYALIAANLINFF